MAYLNYAVAIAALVIFSLSDTIAKSVSRRYGNYISAVLILGFGTIPLFASLFFLPQSILSLNSLWVALVAGFLMALGFVLVYKSLSTEQAANTWVFINIPSAAIVLFGLFALGEHASPLQLFSVLLIFIGALLVTVTKEFKFNKLLLPAIMGNICWSIFVVLVIYSISTSASESTGFFFVARLAGFLMLLIYLLATRKLKPADFRKLKRPNLAALAAGVFDGAGQAGIAVYTLLQFVALGAAIGALEPALVAVLGIAAYREKMTGLQMFGLLVSVAAAVAINFV